MAHSPRGGDARIVDLRASFAASMLAVFAAACATSRPMTVGEPRAPEPAPAEPALEPAPDGPSPAATARAWIDLVDAGADTFVARLRKRAAACKGARIARDRRPQLVRISFDEPCSI